MFKNQFPNFRPEFGNEDHIRILERMKEYYRVRGEYEAILAARRQSAEKRAKCRELKRRIREMIAYERNSKKPA